MDAEADTPVHVRVFALASRGELRHPTGPNDGLPILALPLVDSHHFTSHEPASSTMQTTVGSPTP